MSQIRQAPPVPVHAPVRRQRLGASFDTLAEYYTAGRPTYPAEFVQTLLQPLLDRTDTHRTVLEVGAGTGQATQLLPQFFAQVTSMEPGRKLCEEASQRHVSDPHVAVHQSTFEDWSGTDRHDCVFSASAFHWADPRVSYEKAAALLKPSGRLVFVSYSDVIGSDTWEEQAERIRAIYRRLAPQLTPPFGTRRLDELRSRLKGNSESIAQALEYLEFGTPEHVTELPIGHWFGPATVLVDRHDRRYTGEGIVAALSSYGGFRGLEQDTARQLADEIRAYVEEECGNQLLRSFALTGLAADRATTLV
ncbi:class I SAM-dependent methyltransferase [Streptomyces sp. NPDC053513]|uniref:class I SAM-dependent methyltransferase n=1 Tax=unclassified Streptomyces TaxID=2593676 RepID=UPI0037D203FD